MATWFPLGNIFWWGGTEQTASGNACWGKGALLIQPTDFRNVTDRIGASALQICHLARSIKIWAVSICSILFCFNANIFSNAWLTEKGTCQLFIIFNICSVTDFCHGTPHKWKIESSSWGGQKLLAPCRPGLSFLNSFICWPTNKLTEFLLLCCYHHFLAFWAVMVGEEKNRAHLRENQRSYKRKAQFFCNRN